MTGVAIQQMARRVAELIEDRHGIRGAGLAEKLRKGGRVLPRAVRAQAAVLAQAADMAANPKLALQIDQGEVAAAYDVCVRHLGGIDAGARRRGVVVGMLTSVAFSLLGVALILAAVLYWRGFL